VPAVPAGVQVDHGDGGVQRVVVDGNGHVHGPRQARRRRQQARAVRPLARVETQGRHHGRSVGSDDGVSRHHLVGVICVDGWASGGAQQDQRRVPLVGAVRLIDGSEVVEPWRRLDRRFGPVRVRPDRDDGFGLV